MELAAELTRRDLLQRAQQIAPEQAVAEGLTQRALGNLSRQHRRLTLWGRRGGDECAKSPAHFDHTLLEQRAVGVLDGVGVELQVFREHPGCRQALARFEDADSDRSLQFVRDLPVDRPGIVFSELDEHVPSVLDI